MENINISIIDMVIVLSYMVGCVILGFIKFDQHIFVLGDEAQTDIMMKLKLK